MSRVRVEIEGRDYTDFVSLELQRDKEEMSCSGSIVLSWPGAEAFTAQTPKAEDMKDGAKITVWLDDKKAGTGRIDKRTGAGSPTQYRLTLTFRGLSASLVDSSADHPSGQENKKSPGDIAKKLAEGYESKIKDKSGETRQLKRFVLREGETVERAIRTATREFGLVASENEDGDVELKKRGGDEGSGQDLIAGEHFIEWSAARDVAPRFSKVKAKGSKVATDESYGKDAEELAGAAVDQYVKFKKELHILADGDQDKDTLKKRALTEAKRRGASGLSVDLTVPGFTDSSGELWKVGKRHRVSIPIEGLDEQLIIKTVKFTLQADSAETSLSLVPKEAYDSEEDAKSGKTGKAKDSTKAKAGSTKAKGNGGGEAAPALGTWTLDEDIRAAAE